MPRFFVQPQDIDGERLTITGSDARHIGKVLRMRKGDELTVCDCAGTDYRIRITSISAESVGADILFSMPSVAEPPLEVTLYQALPKSAKMETIIQKCTELGISKIVPCITARCVVKLENDSAAKKKVSRWQAVAEEAAKQSQRGRVPEIGLPVAFAEAAKRMKGCELCFVPYEMERERSIRQVLQNAEAPKTAAFFIGPEGGIAPEEAELLADSGIPTVTLGPRILRCETAPIAVLSMLMYELGDL